MTDRYYMITTVRRPDHSPFHGVRYRIRDRKNPNWWLIFTSSQFKKAHRCLARLNKGAAK